MAVLHSCSTKFITFLHEPTSEKILQSIKPSNTADLLAFIVLLITSSAYILRGLLWDTPDPNYRTYFERPQAGGGGAPGSGATTRDIAKVLQNGDFLCVVFWGSQSGTSERFAETLARELHASFGIKALAADLSDYDPSSIARISRSHFAIFILSTYGEGDPSDNTGGLWDWIRSGDYSGIDLSGLQYCSLGLGNSNYKYYNRVVDVVSDALDAAGANVIVPRQKADDANGGTEEDFEAWKDDVFAYVRSLGYKQQSFTYEPTLKVAFESDSNNSRISSSLTTLYNHEQTTKTSDVVALPIKSARELFEVGDRNCVHLELDLNNSDIVYKTGDHIAIWPQNPDNEIDGLVDALGLQSQRSSSLSVASIGGFDKLKIPSSTTLDHILRHSLDICGMVPRKVALGLAQFAPTAEAKSSLLRIGQDRGRYKSFTTENHVTFGRLLQLSSPSRSWQELPLSFVIENLLPLQPRYYSISSSSVISPRRISITALVVNTESTNGMIHGLASNYLLSTTSIPAAAKLGTPSYEKASNDPRMIYAHIRKTKFKLPIMSSTPLVLVCAGTGFAPFRAFIQERTRLQAIGKPCGKIMLFFGCRNQNDFIYREELVTVQAQLGDNLEIITAYSRATTSKVYVQDRVAEESEKILKLLEQGASMYICGQATMAREVDQKLETAAQKTYNIANEDVKAWADTLKRRGKWKADVWG